MVKLLIAGDKYFFTMLTTFELDNKEYIIYESVIKRDKNIINKAMYP